MLSLPPWAEPLAGQSTGLTLQVHAVLSSWWTESQLSLCGPRPPRAGPPLVRTSILGLMAPPPPLPCRVELDPGHCGHFASLMHRQRGTMQFRRWSEGGVIFTTADVGNPGSPRDPKGLAPNFLREKCKPSVFALNKNATQNRGASGCIQPRWPAAPVRACRDAAPPKPGGEAYLLDTIQVCEVGLGGEHTPMLVSV